MMGIITVVTPMVLYPSLWLNPITGSTVTTAPLWGRESRPPLAMVAILCSASGLIPIFRYSTPKVFIKIVRPQADEPVIPEIILVAIAAEARG